jgi:hypothetical protein
VKLFQAIEDGFARRDFVEISTTVAILLFDPCLDRRGTEVFQPAIVIGYFDATIFIGHRLLS